MSNLKTCSSDDGNEFTENALELFLVPENMMVIYRILMNAKMIQIEKIKLFEGNLL